MMLKELIGKFAARTSALSPTNRSFMMEPIQIVKCDNGFYLYRWLGNMAKTSRGELRMLATDYDDGNWREVSHESVQEMGLL